ncbi:LysM domain-containing protein [Leuconostocaceae bacterium ESL0958]|nr:LysM domain-containing protein [Leuconostocaceae bacterium ESL0958]
MSITKKIVFAGMSAALMGTMAFTADQKVNADQVDTGETYTVQAGDTLSEIAQAHNTDAQTLANNSGIQNIDLIYVGDKIKFSADNQKIESVTTTDGQVKTANNDAASATVTPQAATADETQANVQATAATASTTNANVQSTAAVTTQDNSANTNSTTTSSAAKDYIANRESGGSYTVRNGNYVGKYQLSASYLNGDESAANQERVADQYVTSRYGSWENAAAHSQQYGWY